MLNRLLLLPGRTIALIGRGDIMPGDAGGEAMLAVVVAAVVPMCSVLHPFFAFLGKKGGCVRDSVELSRRSGTGQVAFFPPVPCR